MVDQSNANPESDNYSKSDLVNGKVPLGMVIVDSGEVGLGIKHGAAKSPTPSFAAKETTSRLRGEIMKSILESSASQEYGPAYELLKNNPFST